MPTCPGHMHMTQKPSSFKSAASATVSAQRTQALLRQTVARFACTNPANALYRQDNSRSSDRSARTHVERGLG